MKKILKFLKKKENRKIGRILFVSEDSYNKKIIRMMLKKEGFDVVTASYKEDFLSLTDDTFTIILIDGISSNFEISDFISEIENTNTNLIPITIIKDTKSNDIKQFSELGSKASKIKVVELGNSEIVERELELLENLNIKDKII